MIQDDMKAKLRQLRGSEQAWPWIALTEELFEEHKKQLEAEMDKRFNHMLLKVLEAIKK